MAPPWSVRIADASTVSLIVMMRGDMALVLSGTAPVRLARGDVAIVHSTDPFLLADDPATPPHVVVEPGQHCRPLDSSGAAGAYVLGLRTWGNDPNGPCMFLNGTYELPSQVTGRLLDAVPGLVVLRAGEWAVPGVALLAEEFGRHAPGQDVVLDRLVDLVLITSLRAWFARDEGSAPRWWAAHDDPVVGDALTLMHDRPDEPWTLESLAAQIAVSRATLARRFTRLLGQPPMAYLAEWRLSMAATLLRDTTDNVETIGRRVGYANPFAFSTAFKRRYGQAPRSFRQAIAPPGAGGSGHGDGGLGLAAAGADRDYRVGAGRDPRDREAGGELALEACLCGAEDPPADLVEEERDGVAVAEVAPAHSRRGAPRHGGG